VLPRAGAVAAAAILGFFGYGISLVLFIVALRGLGTARTSAYFSIAPFFGAAVALAVLGEQATAAVLGRRGADGARRVAPCDRAARAPARPRADRACPRPLAR